MFTRIPAILIAASLAAVSGAPASGDPSAPTADVQVRIQADRPSAGSLERSEIYRILQGGAPPANGLSDHLWLIAQSLAERGWTPPRVTIRMVVEELPEG